MKSNPVPKCDKCRAPMRATRGAIVSWQGNAYMARRRECLACGQRAQFTLQALSALGCIGVGFPPIDRADGGASMIAVSAILAKDEAVVVLGVGR